jgi:DNA-binding XRE family transcriptional regulator
VDFGTAISQPEGPGRTAAIAAWVQSLFADENQVPVLVGGAAVEILTGGEIAMTTTTPQLTRRRPRSFVEWRQLRAWGKLPARESNVPGYLLRTAREEAGLTQSRLAAKLDITQQAVWRAEQWGSNPTITLMSRWARACGRRLEINLTASSL